MKERLGRNNLLVTIGELIDIYLTKRVSRSAAELSYFLMLSIFPSLICVHAMLVNLLPGFEIPFTDLEGLIPSSTIKVILDYLQYVRLNNNPAMLTAGILGMATTSAAAFRSIHNVMADIQGQSRFHGMFKLLFSFLFSLLFMATIYFAAIVMVSGNWLMKHIVDAIPILRTVSIWQMMKYPVLLLLFIFIIYGIYKITAPKDTKGTILTGAVVAAIILVLVSYVFSWFISMSHRYPLIYGSLASVIILMFWLYVCGNILIMCNALNFVMREHKRKRILRQKLPKVTED